MKDTTQVTYPVKGMYLDGHASAQPENTYRFALNAVNNSTEGEEGFLATEQGNIQAFEMDGKVIIGHLALANDEAIIFSISPTTTRSEIGKLDKFNNYTTILSSNSLDFLVDNHVEATLSTVKGCERVIYFCSPKLYALNIDNLEQYLLAGETVTTANTSGDGWDVDLIKLFPSYSRATIDDITVLDTGGTLPLGTYNVIASYSKTANDVVGWMDFSMSIPIADESFAEGFDAVDGGLNSVVPPTNKAIQVTFNNLDTTYPFLKIAVVANNDGVRTAYILDTIELTSEELLYTITGIEGEDVITSPINEFTVNKAIYEEAKTINQIDNRLLIGNLVEKDVDFSKFQAKANTIKTHWFAKELLAQSGDNTYKSPDTYLDYRSYMSDEVYSLGIVYIFKDGYETPAFHIPGRASNYGYQDNLLPQYIEPNTYHNRPGPQGNWDSSFLIVNTQIDLEDVRHLGFTTATDDIGYGSGLVPRWKAVNTAIRFDTPASGYFAEGDMAYWESSFDYPSTLDCNDDRVFPEGKIRHHKFPDVTLVPHALIDETNTIWKTYPLGLKFTSIEYPVEYADQILGYKIVREVRNNANTSVYDKGLVTTCLYSSFSEELFQPFPYNQRNGGVLSTDIHPKYSVFHSPRTKFERAATGSTHLKIDQKLISVPFPSGDYIEYLETGPVEFRSNSRFSVADSNTAYISTNVLQRDILSQAYVDADTLLEAFFDYTVNNTEQQEGYVINTTDDLPVPTDTIGGDGTYTYLNGNTFHVDDGVHFFYGGLNILLPAQYGQLSSGIYIPCSSNYNTTDNCEIYGGDIFISRIFFKRHALIEDGRPINVGEGTADYVESHMVSFFVESTINCGYRHEGTEETEVYYPKSYSDDLEAFLDFERTINGTIESDLIPNYYAYNSDYSRENDIKIYLPLSQAFDYCSTCSHDYHTRIAYSEQKSLESTADSFSTFLTNNYRDLPQNKGDITKLFVQDHTLYAHLENTLFQVPTNTQKFTSTDSDVFIGSNAFMAIEPIEVKSINEGYLGTKHQWAHLTTEVGTFFISEEKIFLLGEGLFEISAQGLRRFFIENKLRFPDSFRELLLSFASTLITEFTNTDAPASHRGIGWMACYDRVNHRLILHKKDYNILFGVGSVDNPIGFWGIKNPLITYIDGSIVLNSETGWFEQYDATEDQFFELYLTDTTLFENKSITISFDVKNKHWVSFHSYLPQYMFNTYNKVLTTQVELSLRDTGLDFVQVFNTTAYEHNKGNYLQYYDNYYDHILELVSRETPVSSVLKSAGYVGLAREYNSTHKQWLDIPNTTFTKAWLYNDTQSTGLLNTVVTNGNNNPFISINYSPTEVYLYKADKTWKLNSFRDFSISPATTPFSTSSWASIQSGYYIDKIPLASAHDITQSQYTVKKFRDKFVVARYYFTPNEINNYKLLTQFTFTNQKESVR